jgi:hypothetical protein
VGFQARFFGEGRGRRKFPARNGLRGGKPQKTEKTRKKMLFFPRGAPVFLPNRPIFGSFLTVKLLRNAQVAIYEALARALKRRLVEVFWIAASN